MTYGVKLMVSGDFACFTRPEMKFERVSYDVMTPSAARGILEAIYWKPAIRWIVEAIDVLKPIRCLPLCFSAALAEKTRATNLRCRSGLSARQWACGAAPQIAGRKASVRPLGLRHIRVASKHKLQERLTAVDH
jgi:CRISPR-associated Cas5-like protein